MVYLLSGKTHFLYLTLNSWFHRFEFKTNKRHHLTKNDITLTMYMFGFKGGYQCCINEVISKCFYIFVYKIWHAVIFD